MEIQINNISNLDQTRNKGFTLVELIVVLVILAILAAILVPGLLGYIDEAKNKEEVLQAKAIMNAVQSEMAKCYAKFSPDGKVTNDNIFGEPLKSFLGSTDDPDLSGTKFTQRVFNLAGITDDPELILFYTKKYDFNNPQKGTSVKDAFTVISVLYWSKDADKPIYFDFDDNSWEEGSLYTAEIMYRGNKESEMQKKYPGTHKNQILPGHKYAGTDVRIYVMFNDTTLGKITEINDKIEKAMGSN
jgi:prepilin-type N-terminal cleavage/methylation domain-containing protein